MPKACTEAIFPGPLRIVLPSAAHVASVFVGRRKARDAYSAALTRSCRRRSSSGLSMSTKRFRMSSSSSSSLVLR